MQDKDGGADPSAMLGYAQQGLDLQKQIYDDTVKRSEPWYNTGTAAVGQLSKLLGLGGNTATGAKTEAQLREQYLPQYTTKKITTTPGYSVGQDYIGGNFNPMRPGDTGGYVGGGQVSEDVIDNEGLNSTIQRILAEQAASASAAESDPAYGSLAKRFGLEDYQADPGYQFRLSEGNKALERQLNAQGKTFSPEAIKALQTYGQNVASEEYGNAYNRFNNDQGNLFNRLATLSGFGQTATGQVANAGTNYANQGSELYAGMGNAVSAAQQANQASRGSMFNTLANIAGTGAKLYAMSDERLKDNIEPYGKENGHNIYIFRYKDDPTRLYVGCMAQEVLETNPDAVAIMDNGYYAINYAAIGVKFREVQLCH